jgi:hypothetical protein
MLKVLIGLIIMLAVFAHQPQGTEAASCPSSNLGINNVNTDTSCVPSTSAAICIDVWRNPNYSTTIEVRDPNGQLTMTATFGAELGSGMYAGQACIGGPFFMPGKWNAKKISGTTAFIRMSSQP